VISGLAKRVLHHSGLLGLARLARAHVRGVVLRYHALTETADPIVYAAPDICMPIDAFRIQMAFVKRAYTVLPLDALVDAVVRGGTLPPRAMAITFDDGYADNHRLGLPVLRALGLPATVYVATGSVEGAMPFWVGAVRAIALGARDDVLLMPGGETARLDGAPNREAAAKALTRALVPFTAAERSAWLAGAAASVGVDLDRVLAGTMLDWASIRELAAAGWTIGAHTVTHSNVALLDPIEAEAEIARSRDALANAIGAPVSHFCYPNSGGQHEYFGAAVTAVLRRLGFRSATTSRPGALRPGADPFLLPRLGVSPRLAPVAELATAMERQRLAA
jgi:peptidoglycan/xylan/chitin deacetylase (PgdA/CDA1 family)